MKLFKFKSWFLWKDSLILSMSVLTIAETIFAVADFGLETVFLMEWYERFGVIVLCFLLLTIIIAYTKAHIANLEIKLKIRSIPIIIKEGDIFSETGWRVIPFNEFFDTKVDDVVIARNTLNGQLIMNHIKDVDDLRISIKNTKDTPHLHHITKSGRKCYPLGKIIPYQQYLLLAFTHFEDNQAFLTHNDYERCLRTMWQEITRVYANKPIVLPLLGSGITRFNDISEKNNFHLLKCLLCTLKTSLVQINQPITIVLTRQTLDDINLYDIKKLF